MEYVQYVAWWDGGGDDDVLMKLVIKYEGKDSDLEIDLNLEYGWYDGVNLPRKLFVFYWVQPCTVSLPTEYSVAVPISMELHP